MHNYSIIPAPYSVGPEVYRFIPEYTKLYGTKAVVIGGTKAMAAAKKKILDAIEGSELTITDFVLFGTECTFETAKKLEEIPAVRDADMIFAVGGGKAVDTCKLVSIDMDKPYFAFPTIASNCAASSALSIVYNEDGSFCDFVHFLHAARHVFIDTEIIAKAPKEYLWAGIGDTYAKYYEVSISAKGEQLEHFKALGVNLSRMCMETLVTYGEKALKENEAGVAGYDLEQAALAIIITTGWVSMLVARDHNMDYNGGLAHAFFYGLCSIPSFDENHLHGITVGFGVLILLLVDGRPEEAEKLKAFMKTVGIPTTLKENGITLAMVERTAEQMTKDEDLEHYPYKVTKEMIIEAARLLEE